MRRMEAQCYKRFEESNFSRPGGAVRSYEQYLTLGYTSIER